MTVTYITTSIVLPKLFAKLSVKVRIESGVDVDVCMTKYAVV